MIRSLPRSNYASVQINSLKRGTDFRKAGSFLVSPARPLNFFHSPSRILSCFFLLSSRFLIVSMFSPHSFFLPSERKWNSPGESFDLLVDEWDRIFTDSKKNSFESLNRKANIYRIKRCKDPPRDLLLVLSPSLILVWNQLYIHSVRMQHTRFKGFKIERWTSVRPSHRVFILSGESLMAIGDKKFSD